MKVYKYYNFSDYSDNVNFNLLDTLSTIGGGLKNAWKAFGDTLHAPVDPSALAEGGGDAASAVTEAAAPEVAEDGTVTKGPGLFKRLGNFLSNTFKKKKDIPVDGTNPDVPDYARHGYQGEKDATLVEAEGMLDPKSPYFDNQRRKGLAGLWDKMTGKGPKADVEGAAKLLQDKAKEEAAQEAAVQQAAAEKAAAAKAAKEAAELAAKAPRVVQGNGGAKFILDPVSGSKTPITHNFRNDADAIEAYKANKTLNGLKEAALQQRAAVVSRQNGDAPITPSATPSTGAPYSAGQMIASMKWKASQLYPNDPMRQQMFVNRNMRKHGLA